MHRAATVCVFAKPPRPGQAKTRLAAALGDERAAALARAFFEDTWSAVTSIPWATPVLATTDPSAGEWVGVPRARVWSQGGGDLGERLERVLRRALRGAAAALAIGTDTPGLPPALLSQARLALRRADAVLGPCEDGGFYLLGLRRCPPGLLRDLPWGSADTFRRTASRLRERGLRTGVISPWFDVDRLADLECLHALVARGEVRAPRTARALEALDGSGRPWTG
ncbi:MAG TPA: TIGR04282 family arsenosugar biosynthesis glycosyltransferase [Anaeromyxobacter sp.]